VSEPVRAARRFAPATARNRDPILEVLGLMLPESGIVLELASGTGEHVVHFARARPGLVWQPSDPSPEARESIAAWVAAEGLPNVLAPLALDAAAADWPLEHIDAAVCINMLHISPWAATEGLMRGVGERLASGGLLYIYGPFRRADASTAPSNEAFDADLKGRDARWGLRRLEDVRAEAEANGLGFEAFVEMPANNLSLIFRKR
jgi:SAM-dependent methyltransferase